jgi:uncharacterized membrane protein YeiH
MTLIAVFDLAAVFVFAISGALQAGRQRMDVFGMFVVGFVTGVGGGTIRDVLLDRPVFWLEDGRYLAAALAATAVVFFAGRWIETRSRPLAWADCLGLAVAVPLGVAAARSVDEAWPIALAMAVVTGAFGGIIRDVICGEPPMVLHREVYATAALGGAAVNLAVFAILPDPLVAAAACAAATFAFRGLAIAYNWQAPRPKGLRQ